jgi:hypothetical protein
MDSLPSQGDARHDSSQLLPDVDLLWIPLGAGLGNDPTRAQRILELVPSVPTPVWGRDELDAGEMWNSNSVVSWLLTRGGVDSAPIRPPHGGRAPGWDAGLVVATREWNAPKTVLA